VVRCQGHSRAGTQCGRSAIKARQFCKLHGGRVRRGAAHPNFDIGRRSEFVPEAMRVRYEKGLEDPDLIVLRRQLSLTEVAWEDAVQGLGPKTSWELVAEAKRSVERAKESLEVKDPEKLKAAVELCEKELSGISWMIVDIRHRVDEVGFWQDQARKLSAEERKRLEAAQQYITIERMMTLVAALVEIVRRHVKDTKALDGIQRDVEILYEKGAIGAI